MHTEAGFERERTLKVIHVLGFARSGSTILGNLLNECDGYFHIGELRHIWKRVSRGKGRCGCGKEMLSCELWSAALRSTMSGLGLGTKGSLSNFATRMWEIQLAESHTKLHASQANGPFPLESFADAMGELLKNVARLSGARVIVDTSKRPELAAYAKYLESVEYYFLHLVRDARGAVFSRQRRHAQQKGKTLVLRPGTLVADSFRWVRTNLAANAHGGNGHRNRIMRLRYEDLIKDPLSALIEIGEWVGVPIQQERSPKIQGDTVHLRTNHTVHGNLNRFNVGEINLKLDERWKKGLRTRDFLVITALTGPLLSKYGYAIRRES